MSDFKRLSPWRQAMLLKFAEDEPSLEALLRVQQLAYMQQGIWLTAKQMLGVMRDEIPDAKG